MTTVTCTTVVCELHTIFYSVATTRQALSTTGTVAEVGHMRDYVQPAHRRKSGSAANRRSDESKAVQLQTTQVQRIADNTSVDVETQLCLEPTWLRSELSNII
jgi:hypothetical protein